LAQVKFHFCLCWCWLHSAGTSRWLTMWGIVDNLGIKEGIAEFKQQFNKDAKATIANTQFAKDRGIDVRTLDEMEQNITNKTLDLHDRTIGAAIDSVGDTIGGAVDALAKDETIAQLLEIKPEDDEKTQGSNQAEDSNASPMAGSTGEAARVDAVAGVSTDAPADRQHADRSLEDAAGAAYRRDASTAPERSDEGVRPVLDRNTQRSLMAEGAAVNRDSAPSAAPAPLSEAQPASPVMASAAVASSGSSATTSGRSQRNIERVRQLESEVREHTAARSAAEASLAHALARVSELEQQWAELSGVSDDALRQADEAKQQVVSLGRQVEEKDKQLAQAQDTCWQQASKRSHAEQQLQDLEASFQERLQRDISQKEQELLDEVSYLRKSVEVKEKRLQELAGEKATLEKRLMIRGGGLDLGHNSASREAMLEAHTAIAKAFGDVSAEHPCARLLDEPLLKFTAALFRQPIFRRVFYAASALIWAFSLTHALSVAHTDSHGYAK